MDPTPSQPPQSGPSGTGLAPNMAGALSYLFGFVTGIIFLVMEKDRFVRFHAWQSILYSIAYVIIWIVINVILGALFFADRTGLIGTLFGCLTPLLALAFFIIWLLLMYRAYQGQLWKLPVIGDMAEQQASKMP
jgi:uncharacterized membrane protein